MFCHPFHSSVGLTLLLEMLSALSRRHFVPLVWLNPPLVGLWLALLAIFSVAFPFSLLDLASSYILRICNGLVQLVASSMEKTKKWSKGTSMEVLSVLPIDFESVCAPRLLSNMDITASIPECVDKGALSQVYPSISLGSCARTITKS